jgi:hypothetical protein
MRYITIDNKPSTQSVDKYVLFKTRVGVFYQI